MATFKTIHTNYGLAAMAAAEASGVPINLTHMAVGDGNGNPVTPDPAQTGLVREMYRAAVNRVYNDSAQPTMFTAELVIPANVGGFTLPGNGPEQSASDTDGARSRSHKSG